MNGALNKRAGAGILCAAATALSLLFSCGSTPSEKKTGDAVASTTVTTEATRGIRYVDAVRITSPDKNARIPLHSHTTVTLACKDRFTIDSVQYFWNGKPLGTTGAGVTTFSFDIPADKVGTTTLKAVACHPDNKRSVASLPVTVLPDKAPATLRYEVVKSYAHDPGAYTQGLLFHNGYLYEGTGQYGESGIRKTDMATGKVLASLNIDSKLFGEGITLYNHKIYQLTWISRKGFVYDVDGFALESTFTYNTQGWGLTTMGDVLVMSDGSHRLYHIAPESFSVVKEVEVVDHNGPVTRLNELEYIDGLVWANVWMTDRIVVIDPNSGVVKADLDLSDLLSTKERNELTDTDNVLNGIAWNKNKGTIYVTGKRWPKLFELKIIH